MKTKPFSTAGSLHPVLFFALIYAVALLLSVFICSSLFYSCNATSSRSVGENSRKSGLPATPVQQPVNTVAMR
ncbi:MAG: hypothetical protein JNM88_19835 [Chitinophagaceae bacterium]|nr:hypothetical protein [Chitinophagaceae bacterium]